MTFTKARLPCYSPWHQALPWVQVHPIKKANSPYSRKPQKYQKQGYILRQDTAQCGSVYDLNKCPCSMHFCSKPST